MRDDLYFIPMIAAALQAPDARTAMVAAFERIRAMGEDPRYERGYRQLVDFLASAFGGHWEDAADEAGKTILEEFGRPSGVGIVVECDGVEVASCSVDQPAGLKAVGNVKPGDYRLRLDTGRLLWVGHLANEDLLWAEAHPGRDLPMAADTRESSRQPTRRLDLLDGAVILRVYPGVESGTLEIELNDRESDK